MKLKLLTLTALGIVGAATGMEQRENNKLRRLRASGSNIKMPSTGSSHSDERKKPNIALKEKAHDRNDGDDDEYSMSMSMSLAADDERYLGLASMSMSQSDHDDDDDDDYHSMSMGTGTKEDLQNIPTLGGEDKKQERTKIY